jgi:hypothetical protein
MGIITESFTRLVTYEVGGTPSTGPFAVPFPFHDEDTVTVYVDGVETSAFTLNVTTPLGTDGNNVTLDTAVANATVSVMSATGVVRTTGDEFGLAELSIELDRLFAILQEHSQRGIYVTALNEAVSLGNKKVSDVADPEADQDVVTKAYGDANYGGAAIADAVNAAAAAEDAQDAAEQAENAAITARGLAETAQAAAEAAAAAAASDAASLDVTAFRPYKDSVRVATTENITLSGLQTVDGVGLAADDRVLVKDQTATEENGIYVVVDGGVWTRADRAGTWANLVSAMTIVEQGTTNADTVWLCKANAGGTLDTTAVEWERLLDAADIGVAVQSYDPKAVKSDESIELEVGYPLSAHDYGDGSPVTTGTVTVDFTAGAVAHATVGGAFTLAADDVDGVQLLYLTNNGSAGMITLSGITLTPNSDDLTTTDADKFLLVLTRINGDSRVHQVALQ